MKVEMDLRDVQRAMGAFSDQAPFAIKNALNKSAFKVRHHMVKRVWPSHVSVNARGFMGRAMRVTKATKVNLTAIVGPEKGRVSPEGIEAIDRLVFGRKHVPHIGNNLAIPIPGAADRYITKSGKLSKRGKALFDKGNPNTFVNRLPYKGKYYLWIRKDRDLHGKAAEAKSNRKSKRKRNSKIGARPLFVLKPKVRTPAKFKFFRSAERLIKKRWSRIIDREMKNAIKTAFR